MYIYIKTPGNCNVYCLPMEKPGLRAGGIHGVHKTLKTAEGIHINCKKIHRLWLLGTKNPVIRFFYIRINRYNFVGESNGPEKIFVQRDNCLTRIRLERSLLYSERIDSTEIGGGPRNVITKPYRACDFHEAIRTTQLWS